MSKISQRQLDYLEFLVWRSKDADEFTRKCLIWLIRQSQGLTRDVRLVLTETNKVVAGFHDMCSEGGTTHFDELLGLVGADMDLDYGVACLRKGPLTKPRDSAQLSPAKEEIEAIIPASPYKS